MNEPRKDQPAPTNDLVVGHPVTPPRRLAPIELQKTADDLAPRSPIVEIPMQEIRRQNDVDRWRNKLRLQEKFEVNSTKDLI